MMTTEVSELERTIRRLRGCILIARAYVADTHVFDEGQRSILVKGMDLCLSDTECYAEAIPEGRVNGRE